MYVIINADAIDIVSNIEKCIFHSRKQLLVLQSETYVSLVVCFYVIQIKDSLLWYNTESLGNWSLTFPRKAFVFGVLEVPDEREEFFSFL